MSCPRKLLDLPLSDRPKWSATDRGGELLYLGWGLRSYGRYPTTLPTSVSEWSYSVILRGTPTLLLRDGPCRLAPNKAALIASPRTYTIGFRDEPDALAEVLIWVWQTPPLVPQVRPAPGGHLLFHLDAESRKRLETVHAACRREVARADLFAANMLRGLRMQLDIELARRLGGQNTKADRRILLDTAIRWMRQNLQHTNPVFLLCDYLQVARSTLDELFLGGLGESPSAHYRRLRMEKARELLDRGQSVKEISFQLGYKHSNDFSRAFHAFEAKRSRAPAKCKGSIR